MKRSTARWTTALAAAALISLPTAGFAQTPAPQQTPPSGQTTPAPTSGQTSTATSAADHIREAKQALEAVPAASVPAGSRQKLAQLKNHLNNLNKIVASSDKAGTSGSASEKSGANKKSSNWGTEAAAIDKLVSDLTTEVTDDTAKEKLMEVRRHVTELASSMSGTGGMPSDPSAAAGSTAAAGADTMGARPSASSQSTQPSPSTSPSSTSPSPSSTYPSPSQQPTSQSPTTTSPSPTTSQPSSPDQPSAAPGQVDAQAAKQALSEARESLAQLTSLPEASKLQGEARNQVSQLISNFNELITTQSDWKAAYAKVSANLDALIGPDGSASPSAAGTTGTMGAPPAATGTTGTGSPAMQIEPAVRTKLQEFRTHLKEFEQAAGGVNMAAGTTGGAMAPSATPSSTANPASPSSPPSPTPSSEPSSPSPTPSSPSPTSPSGTSGIPGATGTSGTMAATPSDDQAAKPAARSGHAEADKHIDAIQDILNQAQDGKLDKAQTEQIKTHLAQLRQLIGQTK